MPFYHWRAQGHIFVSTHTPVFNLSDKLFIDVSVFLLLLLVDVLDLDSTSWEDMGHDHVWM